MQTTSTGSRIPELMHRRVRFELGPDFDPMWSPRLPEVAIATNAVSLVMPHVEPYVARCVERDSARLDPALRAEVGLFARQEAQHHGQHRQLNDRLVARYPALRFVERLMGATFGFLSAHGSAAFGRAFAAGFETMALSGARWMAPRATRLFAGADPVPASLMLWHLAEEVEHRGVAWDVHVAHGGGRIRHALGAITSLVLLVVFAAMSSVVMLAAERRILNPLAWLRLITWSVGVVLEMLPELAVSFLSTFDPRSEPEPGWYGSWLTLYDHERHHLPLWNDVG